MTERPVPPEVRALLVCPRCRGELADVDGGLVCPRDRLLFPVEAGVPFLVEACARPATDTELAEAR